MLAMVVVVVVLMMVVIVAGAVVGGCGTDTLRVWELLDDQFLNGHDKFDSFLGHDEFVDQFLHGHDVFDPFLGHDAFAVQFRTGHVELEELNKLEFQRGRFGT